MRWRIERDSLELKQQLGVGRYEGRSWRGFRHYASLSVTACAFVVAEQLASGGSSARKDLI
jgi:SRSO17 transposase